MELEHLGNFISTLVVFVGLIVLYFIICRGSEYLRERYHVRSCYGWIKLIDEKEWKSVSELHTEMQEERRTHCHFDHMMYDLTRLYDEGYIEYIEPPPKKGHRYSIPLVRLTKSGVEKKAATR